ncbi:RDD family protein [Amycolatopsis pigmentata]|uniref:RDD family protein n=1 Tax=Amycolatopsis pigmentata TaxID=450801 RepID=A0ABW5G1M4_9PSEU
MSVDDVPTTAVVLRRYAQYALDFLLLMIAVLLLLVGGLFLALKALGAGWPRQVLYVPVAVAIVAGLGCTLLNEVWLPHKRGGATLAMRWLGLRIVKIDGESPRLRDYLLRWLLNCVDGQCFGLLGAVIIAVTPRHQRLGDIVARTLVVRVR